MELCHDDVTQRSLPRYRDRLKGDGFWAALKRGNDQAWSYLELRLRAMVEGFADRASVPRLKSQKELSEEGSDSVETIARIGKEAVYESSQFGTRELAFMLKALALIVFFLFVHPLLVMFSVLMMLTDVLVVFYMDAAIEHLNEKKTLLTQKFWASVTRNLNGSAESLEVLLQDYDDYRSASINRDIRALEFRELWLNTLSLSSSYIIKVALLASVAFSGLTYGQFTTAVALILTTQTPSGIYIQLQRLVIDYRHNLRELGKVCGINFGGR